MYCGECGGSFAAEDLARFGSSYVCPNCKPGFVQRMREGAQHIGSSMGAVRYGGFWIRFVAVFIDGLIMSVVIVPIMLALMFAGGGFNLSNPQNPPNIGLLLLVYPLILGIVLVYQVYFLSTKSATPGKMAVGLKVVTTDGQNLTLGRAVGRYFAYLLSGFTLYIGYIIAAFDQEKRALHDHICNTRVIYK
jgi:uncharacterized RDD family membrane protein YckC